MLSIAEAQQQVLEDVPVLGQERLYILDALGRVLAEDIRAKRNVPAADNSAMDGYACRHEDVKSASEDAPVRLRIIGESPAGKPFQGRVGQGEAVRIMTGGLVPDGADTVIMVEYTRRERDEVLCLEDPGADKHIRRTGEDVRTDEAVLTAGDLIRAPEVGMLATLGHAYAYVHQRPLVAILSTGDELVDLDEPFTVGKVVCSNTYSLAAQVLECGAQALSLGIASDNEDDLRAKIGAGLRADVLISSGGVSVGKYDLVKTILSDMGMKLKFWKVAMKPGKPLVFGTLGHKPVFGLPGNPTSAMISFEQFVRPALLKMMGHVNLFRPFIKAVLAEDAPDERKRLHLVRCKLFEEDGVIMAATTGNQSSGALRSMILADGLLVLQPGEGPYHRGKTVRVQVLHENSPLSAHSPFEDLEKRTAITPVCT